MNYLLGMVLAMAVSMAVIPMVWRFAPQLGLLDLPDGRKVHKKAVPRVGGWGIVIGTLLPVVMLLPFDPLVQSYVMGSLILFLFGVLDDIYDLDHYVKFLGQITAVAIVVVQGGLWIERMPLMGFDPVAPGFGIPFTFFAIVGMTNAINHSDGLDGLAGGESLLSLIVIAVLAYIADGYAAVVMAMAAIGGTLGFLCYNTHPAQVFMGDAGSQFLGFTLGFLAVLLTQKVHPTLSPASTLLFLGLPIIDILAVLFQRVSQGMHWFHATRNHIHHRLLDHLKFTHKETVAIIYSIQAFLVISAVLLRYEHDAVIIGFYLAIAALVFSALIWAERNQWQMQPKAERSRRRRLNSARGVIPILSRAVLRSIGLLVPIYMIGASFGADDVTYDFGVISAVMFVIMLIHLAFGKAAVPLSMRVAIYVAAIFAAYLTVYAPADAPLSLLQLLDLVYFSVLAIAIALTMRYATDKKFKATPLDYLLALGVLAIGIFGQRYLQMQETGALIVKGMILLYGCEVLIERAQRRWNPLSISSALALGILGVRGIFSF